MTIQTVNLGSAPTGAGGDTFRSTGAKMNENFTNNSHAASRYVGTAVGNVMEVGAFGFGGMGALYSTVNTLSDVKNIVQNQSRIFRADGGSVFQLYAPTLYMKAQDTNVAISFGPFSGDVKAAGWTDGSSDFTAKYFFRTSSNTTVDANGFLKNASPVVKLFADKIEPNEEAAEQPLSFEKPGIGHYLVKGSSGFAKEGWWIEIPTDTHGNKICAVEYQTLENGDLEIKTYKKKMNEEGDIVANLDAPIDIPNNANGEPRWIDIRLNSIKKTIVRKIPRTEKQPRMVQQVKYAPQLTYITKYEDLFDDEGKAVIVDGKNYKKPVTHIQTDQNGTPILSNQPVINENGEPVFEWVQAVDSEGNPVFDDVPVLDKDGNPIYDEVTYDPE
ncbi:phage tail fiber protein [Acinetobacter baumannii]